MVNPHGEPPSAYWLQILSLSRLRRQLPRQREPREWCVAVGRPAFPQKRPRSKGEASPASSPENAKTARPIGRAVFEWLRGWDLNHMTSGL